jgi:hypothetical protein
MLIISKFSRSTLPLLLVTSVLTTGTPSASAAVPVDGSYKCSTGIKDAGTPAYTITSGVVSNGSTCTGAVVIPTGVTSFAYLAFNTSGITSINIPSSVTSIGQQVFGFTASLTSITIPDSVTSIGQAAFAYSGLISITIPDSVTSIGWVAFYNATALTSITIPSSVTSIGLNAFAITTSLTQYTYCGDADLTNTGLASKTRISACSLAGLSSAFSSPSSYDGRFTVQITDFDSGFTYSVSSNAGQASINATGLVTVTGLSPDQSVTVTVTTTRTGYASGSGSITARSQVAPMLPGTKPNVTISDTLITCTIGSYSAAPTSAAFSLFVDGKHVSTNFSALGEYLPDWIIPWATSSTITRTATLTAASWTISDSYKAKAITCATLGYSKSAIGFTASAPLVAR